MFGSNDFMKPIIIKGKVNAFGIIKWSRSIKKIIIKKTVKTISNNVVIVVPYK